MSHFRATIFFSLSYYLLVSVSLAGTQVIYGEDDRKDFYQTSNPLFQKIALSTAAMIRKDIIITKNKTTYSVPNPPTLSAAGMICTDERFSTQTSVAECTGFLVGPDLLVTAGHCYLGMGDPWKACEEHVWVFDYLLKNEEHRPLENISSAQIFECKEVVSSDLNVLYDFAIIRLKKKVENRSPLSFRTSGILSNNASLAVIGHPSGLPLKIADQGRVLNNNFTNMFATNLDTFQGNSGSPIIDVSTGLVEGILVQGKTDYVPSISWDSSSCRRVARCQEDGTHCTGGEESGIIKWGEIGFRIKEISSQINQALSSTP